MDRHYQLSQSAGIDRILPFLKFRIAHLATLDCRESSFVENSTPSHTLFWAVIRGDVSFLLAEVGRFPS